MKKVTKIYSNLYSWENLYFSAQEAGRGKKSNPQVNIFFIELEKNLFALQQELQNKTYIPRKYQQFTIYDPKKRLISAAHFRDRVVHHAICRLLEPVFENFFIYHSYACRKDKGIHRALKLAKQYAKQYPYFLKMDIAKFYDSVEHSVLKQKLSACIQDKDMLWLLDQIIDSIPNENKIGLPIGNLTSQYFANYILSWVDHYAKEVLRIKPYLRYMDDCAPRMQL